MREVWRDAWDYDRGTVLPRAVTDAAIRAGRNQDLDRLVVHYMQPHFPCIAGHDGDTPGGPTGAGGDGVALESWGDRPLAVLTAGSMLEVCGTRAVHPAARPNRQSPVAAWLVCIRCVSNSNGPWEAVHRPKDLADCRR